MKRATITQPPPPAEEIPAQIIATAIKDLADGMKILNSTPLRRKAILVLLSHTSKVPQRTVEIVLNNLENLANDWLK